MYSFGKRKIHRIHSLLNRARLLLGIICLLPALQQCFTSVQDVPDEGPYIEVIFNQPGVNRQTMEDPMVDEKVARMVDNARQTVYFSFYGFSRRPIIDAVVRAVKRGLDVQFAGDMAHYSGRDVGYMEFEQLLAAWPNAKMAVGNSQSIMHNKWIVVDGQTVMTGTGNITNSEMDNNNNAWVIIRDKELAEDFIAEHAQMMQGRFGHAKTRQDYNNHFDVGGIKVENYFSPYEDAMSRFLQAVGDANSNIHFMIFAFTHDQLGRLLLDKHREFVNRFGKGYHEDASGVRRGLRGVMDRSQLVHAQFVEVYRFAGFCAEVLSINNPDCIHPVDFRRDGNENTKRPGDWQAGGGRLHSKVIVVDAGTPEAKVLMGSFNWSPNANENNDENLIVIHSPKIADRFLEIFDFIYANAGALPGDTGSYQDIVISEVNWAGSRRKIDDAWFDHDGNEFIELYNPNDKAVDISFWSFRFPILEQYEEPGVYVSGLPGSEAVRKKAVFGFPEGTLIPPKGFFVVYEPDLRNDNINGYSFEPADLYIPEDPATHGNTVSVYNPFNELSNFISLYDRRSSRTYRTIISSPFTLDYSVWANRCGPAYSWWIDRFSSAQGWDIYRVNEDGPGDNFPYKLGLDIRLHDSRGNLVDVAGTGRLSGAVTHLQRGGYFANSEPAASADPGTTFLDFETEGCYSFEENYYPVSMERAQPAGGSWGAGNNLSSWENATSNTAADRMQYIRTDYQKTIATPGRPNSRWTTEAP
jgi:phosphatidylserine/phosphatidylglycerophosphate/cardiolipin synthase-like enzyme